MISLSTTDIEKQIAIYRLQFSPLHDDAIEWQYQPPPFVVAFVQYVEKFRRVPAQLGFKEYYFEINRAALRADAEKYRDKNTRAQKERALIARLLRAYPSFVRDAYLFALLREGGVPVAYDTATDVTGGVDLIAQKGEKNIQVHVYLDSPRANEGRAKKEKRHHFNGDHFDLVLREQECKHVGEFWLPTQKHVEEIKRALTSAR